MGAATPAQLTAAAQKQKMNPLVIVGVVAIVIAIVMAVQKKRTQRA